MEMNIIICTAVFSFLFIPCAYAGEWHETAAGTSYVGDDGYLCCNTWEEIDGKQYFFNGNGFLVEDPAKQFQDLEFEEGDFPLSHLRDEFVVDERGVLTGKWDIDYIWQIYPDSGNRMVDWAGEKKTNLPESMTAGKTEWTQQQEAAEIVMQHAVEVGNLDCFCFPGKGEELVALAKLSGVKLTGYQHRENDEQVLALEKEIKSFLDSFDWKNASDFEKAVRVSERIMKADYFNDSTTKLNDVGQEYPEFGECYNAYGCLVNGKAVCEGYSDAANLLSVCIDLPHGTVARWDTGHAYPIYFINGIWLSHEPTSKDNKFMIFDWQDGIDSGLNYCTIAQYCIRTGYEMPKDVKTAFPDSFGYTSVYSWNRIQNDFVGDQGISFSYLNKLQR